MSKNFDPEQLEQLAGGDKAFEKELLNMFVGDIERSLNQLETAIGLGNKPIAVQELAHYIKGASANVGAVGMSQAAAQLETMAKEGNLQTAVNSLQQLQALHDEIKRMAAA